MTRIARVHAREVFDSRGRPTVEVEVFCAGASRAGRAIVPSGASTGRHEALELRDRGSERLEGSGVGRAVRHVIDELGPRLAGFDAADQSALDRLLCELDGTSDKSRLGANALLGVSLAAAHAAAEARAVPLVEHLADLWNRVPSAATGPTARTAELAGGPLLPLPMVNMISGGLHAGGNLDFQDFLAVPVGARSYREALDWVVAVYRNLGRVLSAAGHEGRLVGDEGGYGPRLRSNSEAVEALLAAIERSGLRPGRDVAIALDVAATHFHDEEEGGYRLASTGDQLLSAEEMVEMLAGWVESYPIVSIEDALAEDDWEGWTLLSQRLAGRVQLVGDDLFVTNRARIERGIAAGAGNSVLIKPNQVGTLSETFAALRLALDAGYWPVVSARSGETEDATIADLVVATGAGQIKIGSVVRSERLAKYNQLLRLEEQLGARGRWLGGRIFESLPGRGD